MRTYLVVLYQKLAEIAVDINKFMRLHLVDLPLFLKTECKRVEVDCAFCYDLLGLALFAVIVTDLIGQHHDLVRPQHFLALLDHFPPFLTRLFQ